MAKSDLGRNWDGKDFLVWQIWRFLTNKKCAPVQNSWKSLWVSLWERRGKVWRGEWKSTFSTKIVWKKDVFHVWVEKFYLVFYTCRNRGKVVVLHNFHRPYYNYY